VIGVIDSGTDWRSPSFSPDGSRLLRPATPVRATPARTPRAGPWTRPATTRASAASTSSRPSTQRVQNDTPQALINALDEVSPDRVVILGGPVAVSQRVEDQLNEEYSRWAG
jgi:hypothetical protein